MKYTNNIFKKTALLEEYLPLTIKSDSPLENANYLIFRYEDNSLLEIAFNENGGNIYRVKLIICKNYTTVNTTFTMPTNSRKGDILVDREADIMTSKFECIIYKDAIRIETSDDSVADCIVSDNIIWELNKEGKLISITLYDQSAEVIEHAIKELSFDNQ